MLWGQEDDLSIQKNCCNLDKENVFALQTPNLCQQWAASPLKPLKLLYKSIVQSHQQEIKHIQKTFSQRKYFSHILC